MESFVKNNNCRILPSLDNNIKNGNSLVDEKYIEFNSNILNNPEMVEKLKYSIGKTNLKEKNSMQL